VIGYYGAIAEWFDLDLLEQVAQRHAECLVLMVGADTAGAQQRLRYLTNVEFTGEVPYAELPYYLHGFDVCLLPFPGDSADAGHQPGKGLRVSERR